MQLPIKIIKKIIKSKYQLKINSINKTITFKNNNNQDDTVIHSPEDNDYVYYAMKNPQIVNDRYGQRQVEAFNLAIPNCEKSDIFVHHFKQDTMWSRANAKYDITGRKNEVANWMQVVFGFMLNIILLNLYFKDKKKFMNELLSNTFCKIVIPLSSLLIFLNSIDCLRYIIKGERFSKYLKNKLKNNKIDKQNYKTGNTKFIDKNRIKNYDNLKIINKFSLLKKYINMDEYDKNNMLSIDTLYEIKPLLDPDMRMTDEEFMIRSLQNIARSIPEYSSRVIIPSDAEIIARKRKEKELNTDVPLQTYKIWQD